MTTYQQISIQNEPNQSLYIDEADRPVYGFNLLATRTPSSTFEEELVAFLVSGGMNAANIYGSINAKLPQSGTVLTVISTGGPSALYEHDKSGPAWFRSTAQVACHGKDAADAKAVAYQAYNILAKIVNMSVL